MALKGLFQLKQFYDSISKLLLFPSFLPVFVPAQRNPAVPLNFKLNSPLTCISIVQKGSIKAVEQTQGSQQTKTTWGDGLWFERVGTNIQWLRLSLTGLCFQCISCVFLGCFSGLVRCAALQLGKYYSDLEAVLQSYSVPNVNKKGLPSVFKPRDTIHLISDFKVFFFLLLFYFFLDPLFMLITTLMAFVSSEKSMYLYVRYSSTSPFLHIQFGKKAAALVSL